MQESIFFTEFLLCSVTCNCPFTPCHCVGVRARVYHSVSKFLAKLSVAKCMAHRINATHVNVHGSTYFIHTFVSCTCFGLRVLGTRAHSVRPTLYCPSTKQNTFTWNPHRKRRLGSMEMQDDGWVYSTRWRREKTTTKLKFIEEIVCISNLLLSREKNNGKGSQKNICLFFLPLEGCFASTYYYYYSYFCRAQWLEYQFPSAILSKEHGEEVTKVVQETVLLH